jgi:hypothetical protein
VRLQHVSIGGEKIWWLIRLTVLCLTCCAMAELAIKRLTAAQLVLDLTAVAVGLVLDIEVIDLLVMYAVGRALFPFRNASR